MLYEAIFVSASVVILVIIYLIVSARLKMIYHLAGIDISVSKILNSTLVASLANMIAPYGTGSVIVRPLVLSKTSKIPKETSIAVSLIEHTIDMSTNMIVVISCAILLSSIKISSSYFVTFFIPAVILVFCTFYFRRTQSILEKILSLNWMPRKLRFFIKKKNMAKRSNIIGACNSIQNSHKKNTYLPVILLLSVAIFLIQPLSIQLFLMSISVKLEYTTAFIILWLPFILGRVSTIPNGLGVQDATTIYLLSLYGVPLPQATLAAIAWRVLYSVFMLISGTFASINLGINIFNMKKGRGIENVRNSRNGRV